MAQPDCYIKLTITYALGGWPSEIPYLRKIRDLQRKHMSSTETLGGKGNKTKCKLVANSGGRQGGRRGAHGQGSSIGNVAVLKLGGKSTGIHYVF